MDNEQALKKQVIKSANSVKRKLKMIRDIKSNTEMVMESVFKPITDPLKQVCIKNSQEINNTPPIKTKKQRLSTYKKRQLSDHVDSDTDSNQTSKHINNTVFLKNRKSEVESNEDEENSTSEHSEWETDKDEEKRASEYSESEPDTSALSFQSSENVSPMRLSSENIPFGVRREREKLMMGTLRVFVTDSIISVGSKTFVKTPGLMELLFKKTPELDTITEDDKQNYKTILLKTNAHRRDNDPAKPIKSNKGRKYTQIIRPLFMKLAKNCASTESISQGSGLTLTKKLNQNIDYVYWDDPNELVNRLKLLIASRDAGNTGLDNEIISIIEELQESGIIN